MAAAGVACARAFAAAFGRTPRVYRAPGRINLIGEHTDYNDGWVMPASIRQSAWVGVALRNDREVVLRSEQFPGAAAFHLDAAPDPGAQPRWSRTLVGLARLLDQYGQGRLRGAELMIHGEVPIGAGLSSSAAVEVATGFALAHVQGLELDRTGLARLCQRASHEFGGTRCGIMDLFIACHGRTAALLELDTRSLLGRWHAWPAALELVVCDTGVHHDNAASGYNQRRMECEEAARRLGLASLRDLKEDELRARAAELPPPLARRCRHVVSENARVAAAAAALDRGDFPALGRVISASHASLRDDYEVSCPELDRMAELCQRQPGVHGARMMGAGFGGCVLALTEPGRLPALQREVGAAYFQSTGMAAAIWRCEPGPGVEAVEEHGLGPTPSAL